MSPYPERYTLDYYRVKIRKTICSCGFTGLRDLPIQHYVHPGGWKLEGFPKLQWLYVECPKCFRQWALWKLGVRRT